METTRDKLVQLQSEPNSTTALSGLSREAITGDLLTANIWSWFADVQGHGRLASSQTTITTRNGRDQDGNLNNTIVTSGMYDRPGMQYGLFHAHVQPNKLFNSIVAGASFKGMMMDIGHARSVRWVMDSGLDDSSPFNPVDSSDPNQQQVAASRAFDDTLRRWVAYNKFRGQFASSLEHSVPQRYMQDTSQCSLPGDADALKPPCTQGVSAVKLLAMAQAQGQRVFKINGSNAASLIPQLQHRSTVIDEVWNAVNSGKEVTIHQSSVNSSGFNGAGYVVIDPTTGSGAYLIEGGANGAFYFALIMTVLIALGGVIIAIGTGGALLGAFVVLSAVFTNWVLKTTMLNLTAQEEVALQLVELVITFIAFAMFAPGLLLVEFIVEVLLTMWAMLMALRESGGCTQILC